MKKKVYSSSEAVVVEVHSIQLLAGSPVLGGDYSGGDVLAPAFDDAELESFFAE